MRVMSRISDGDFLVQRSAQRLDPSFETVDDDFGYFLDVGSEDRWGDYSFGSTQAEWEWLENYSDGW